MFVFDVSDTEPLSNVPLSLGRYYCLISKSPTRMWEISGSKPSTMLDVMAFGSPGLVQFATRWRYPSCERQ
jgi:hypothetical protein